MLHVDAGGCHAEIYGRHVPSVMFAYQWRWIKGRR